MNRDGFHREMAEIAEIAGMAGMALQGKWHQEGEGVVVRRLDATVGLGRLTVVRPLDWRFPSM